MALVSIIGRHERDDFGGSGSLGAFLESAPSRGGWSFFVPESGPAKKMMEVGSRCKSDEEALGGITAPLGPLARPRGVGRMPVLTAWSAQALTAFQGIDASSGGAREDVPHPKWEILPNGHRKEEGQG